MSFVPTPYDYGIVGLTIAAALLEITLLPAFRRRRVTGYAYMSAYLWLIGIAIITLWYSQGRSWDQLLLGRTSWWRLAIGFAVALCYIVFMALQRRAMIQPRARVAVARAMTPIAWMIPRTLSERKWSVGLSIAAGTCEEIIFRGFALTFFAYFVHLPAAILISALAFGLGHAYQDRRAILGTGAFGLAMTALALVSGSLLPAIAVHVFQDLIMMDIGHRAFASDSTVIA